MARALHWRSARSLAYEATASCSGTALAASTPPGAVPVRIFNDEAELFAFFMSDPGVAEFHARERLLDIATYIEADVSYSIGSAE
jgi:hypothetical protein